MAGLDARYVGRQWLRGDEENATRRLSDYTVADLSLTLSWGDFELRGAVRNLFDRRVYTFGTFARIPRRPARRCSAGSRRGRPVMYRSA